MNRAKKVAEVGAMRCTRRTATAVNLGRCLNKHAVRAKTAYPVKAPVVVVRIICGSVRIWEKRDDDDDERRASLLIKLFVLETSFSSRFKLRRARKPLELALVRTQEETTHSNGDVYISGNTDHCIDSDDGTHLCDEFGEQLNWYSVVPSSNHPTNRARYTPFDAIHCTHA
jgi:hypothetical protein